MRLLNALKFQLILSPIRDWNTKTNTIERASLQFQLILSPIRDWNKEKTQWQNFVIEFQLILSPIRDWNKPKAWSQESRNRVPINLKSY